MELKNVFIDAGKSLGNITFAGAGKENQQRANGRRTVTSRTYSLLSTRNRWRLLIPVWKLKDTRSITGVM